MPQSPTRWSRLVTPPPYRPSGEPARETVERENLEREEAVLPMSESTAFAEVEEEFELPDYDSDGVGSSYYDTGSEGGDDMCVPASMSGCGETREHKMLHVFSGRPRVGGFEDCGAARGVQVTSVDILLGGLWHDVRQPEVRAGLLSQVRGGCYAVVWIGLPCASGTVHWTGSKKRPRIRDQPDRAPGLPAWLDRYVDLHNLFLEFTETLATAAFCSGATFIVENPPDYGDEQSPYFRWIARSHCPLWLTSWMVRLQKQTGAVMVTGCQCMLGGAFKKPTSLLAAGPRAHKLGPFGRLWCTHSNHARVAAGWKADGTAHSADAAAYPVPMCLWIMAVLFSDETEEADALGFAGRPEAERMAAASVVQASANRRAAHRLTVELSGADGENGGSENGESTELEAASALLRLSGEWRSAPRYIPAHWPEYQDMGSERLEAGLATALPYLSRRRCEPEEVEALARRQVPAPHTVAKMPARRAEQVAWPAGAPPRPIHIAQLYHPGVYADIRSEIEGRSRRMGSGLPDENGNFLPLPKEETRIWLAEKCQPEFARQCTWDCSDPEDCVPLQPYSDSDPPRQEAMRGFFLAWGRYLEYADEDMIHQVTVTGAESRATMSKDTTLMGHHAGLRNKPKPAFENIAEDTAKGWVTEARLDLWTVPTRAVPKNCLTQLKWRIFAGELFKKLKTRVTTDDSICPVSGEVRVDGRNPTIDKSGWGGATLPGPRTLAEAVAIIKAAAEGMRLRFGQTALARVALWALDLSDAYRALAVARSEWWQQAYVWSGGVKLDRRCVFGSAHLVDLFQRVSTFVLTVAGRRIREFDRCHPYDADRTAWRAWRQRELGAALDGNEQAETAQYIYIDDGAGATPLAPDEPVAGLRPDDPSPAKVFVGVDPGHGKTGPRVRVLVFYGMSRPQVHMGLAEQTFKEAGWCAAADKMQLGEEIELLGHAIDTRGAGRIHAQEAKRRGIRTDIATQLSSQTGEVTRDEVEELTGRCSFLAQVICEGNAYLQPMYRIKNQSWKVYDRALNMVTVRHPRKLSIDGNGHTQRAYRQALAWWDAALSDDASAPLAPRTTFPRPGDAGCAYQFTDAARERGTGYGAHTTITIDGVPFFLWYEDRWEPEVLTALQRDEMSMPAGECIAAVVFADALLSSLGGVTHLLALTDSDATAKAFTTGSSGAPQLNCAIMWLIARHPLVQFLGLHQPGKRNGAADGLSRQREDGERVLAEAKAAGLTTVRVRVDRAAVASLISDVRACPLRR
jgi:hypothetical protein